jgi:hypothetical protein
MHLRFFLRINCEKKFHPTQLLVAYFGKVVSDNLEDCSYLTTVNHEGIYMSQMTGIDIPSWLTVAICGIDIPSWLTVAICGIDIPSWLTARLTMKEYLCHK